MCRVVWLPELESEKTGGVLRVLFSASGTVFHFMLRRSSVTGSSVCKRLSSWAASSAILGKKLPDASHKPRKNGSSVSNEWAFSARFALAACDVIIIRWGCMEGPRKSIVFVKSWHIVGLIVSLELRRRVGTHCEL